jgi:hypothetical protein
MKFVTYRPFADPNAAARKLLELANAFVPIQDGRIYIEKINGPFLQELKGSPAEYKAEPICRTRFSSSLGSSISGSVQLLPGTPACHAARSR